MDGRENLDRLTTGGTSAAVAIKIQMTPLQKEKVSVNRKVNRSAGTGMIPVSRGIDSDQTCHHSESADETSQGA